MARHTPKVGSLASPASGGAVSLGRIELLSLLALQDGQTSAASPSVDALVAFVWAALQTQGQRMLRDGKTLDSAQNNIAELQTQITAFVTKRLPTLRHLQLVE